MGFKYQVGDLNLVSDIPLPILKSKNFDKHDLKVVISSKLQTPDKTIEFLPNDSVLYQDIFGNIFCDSFNLPFKILRKSRFMVFSFVIYDIKISYFTILF